jgi:beta-barrel assembly-enhancing protease
MRRLLAMLILCLLAQPAPALAANDRWPMALRAQMLRLAEVDWRLRQVAAPLCPRRVAGTGLALDHAAAYRPGDRAFVANSLRLGALPQIAAVAPGSPAARARLRPGDEIVAIAGIAIGDLARQSANPALFAEEVTDRLEALPPGRESVLIVRRGKASLRKTLVAEPVCAARTMLDSSPALAAYSDGAAVAITSGLIAFTASDDELALVLGHEFAHVVAPDETPAGAGEDPASEQAADLLGAALAHCAGYDVGRASALWPRYRAAYPPGRLANPSHPAPEQRERAIRAALPGFACPVRLAWGASPQR